MTALSSRGAARRKRHDRIRLRLEGTESRPRLAVFRSNVHIYAQVIDDASGRTLAAASSVEKELRGSKSTKTEEAAVIGRLVAERAKTAGVERVVFDRAGFRYHGRIKSLADAAREAGLEFLAGGADVARIDPNKLALEERVVQINRVAKVVKGGRRFSFSAIVVVGDGQGYVGAGLGKAGEVPEAIRKGVEDAKKNLIRIPMVGTTIPHEVRQVFSASRVMLKPASQGTGVIAGGAVRAVVVAAGIRDILAKTHGSTNPVNVTRCTIEALRSLHSAEELSARRGVRLVSRISGQPAPAPMEAADGR